MTHPRDLERNIAQLQGMFKGKFAIVDGVMLWDSNGNVPFDDMLDAAIELGHNIDKAKCEELRKVQNAASIKRHIEARQNMSAEQKAEEAFERRAAFGPGKKIVDVISGETFRT